MGVACPRTHVPHAQAPSVTVLRLGRSMPSIHVASAPDLEQVTSHFFSNSKPRKSSERSYDEAAAARLWQVSADLVGLAAAG